MKSETRLQIDLVKWLKFKYPDVIFTSTQAGDRRGIVGALMMKRMGYANGTPDLIFFTARGGFHGLLLELKDKAVQSESQKEFGKKTRDEGYAYEVAYGIDQAKDVIERYMLCR